MTQPEYPGIFNAAAAHGFRAFPVRPRDKKPAVTWSEFFERAPTDQENAAWDDSSFNVGVMCGSYSDIAVVDIDSSEAASHVQSLNLPPTPTVKTAKGTHLYFKRPNVAITNRAWVAGFDLDIRSDGGFVVGAGSTHETGVKYEWVISPDDVPFAEFPQAILNLYAAGKSASAASASPVEFAA